MQEKRQTISTQSKNFIIRTAIFFDIWVLTLGWIPIIGWLGSFTWGWILFYWLWMQHRRVRAEWLIISTLGVFQILILLLSPFPILGNFIDIALKFGLTLAIVLLIYRVDTKDKEYNKKMEQTLVQLFTKQKGKPQNQV